MISLNKLTLLHSIRGFAAFYVVIFHAKFALWVGGSQYMDRFPRSEWGIADYLVFASDMITANGGAMVIVFFVLSGFFIAYSFDKNKWELKKFYTNRLIRIYIPFLFSVFFSILALFLVEEIYPQLSLPNVERQFNQELAASYQNFNLHNFLLTLAFLPSGENSYIGFNMVYWSLLYEAIFYLLLPLIINRLRSYLIVSVLTLTASYFFVHQNPFLKFFLSFSIYFAAGLNLFYFLKSRPGWKPVPLLLLLSLIIIFFAAVVLLSLIGWIQSSYLSAGILSILMIILFLNYDIQDNLIIKIFKQLGKISYTLYLFHFPILILVYAVLTKLTGRYLFYDRIYWVGVLAALLLSLPLYYLVEDKSLKWISKLKKQNNGSVAYKAKQI